MTGPAGPEPAFGGAETASARTPGRPWSDRADMVLTAVVASAFAAAAYFFASDVALFSSSLCKGGRRCDIDLALWLFIVVSAQAVGAAIAAILGRALVATICLVGVPLALLRVVGVESEYGAFFWLNLCFYSVFVVIPTAAITTAVADAVKARRAARRTGEPRPPLPRNQSPRG